MQTLRLPFLFALWALVATAASAATTQELYIDCCANGESRELDADKRRFTPI
jgi:hypothetical protein